MPFLVFRRGSFAVHIGIICGSGSFAVQFEDHFRSGDHLRSVIICGAVQPPNVIKYCYDPCIKRFSNGKKYTLLLIYFVLRDPENLSVTTRYITF